MSGRPAKGTLSQGVAFGMLTFAATAVLGFGTGVAVARLFGVHVVGEFALAYAPTGAVWVLDDP